MPTPGLALILIQFLLHADFSSAVFCTKWGDPRQEGVLERKDVPEASGAAASIKYPGRVYWINDSGNKDYLYFSRLSGKEMKKVRLQGTKFRDTEALAVTVCDGEPCVIVADTGNNKFKKRDPELALFYEKDLNGAAAKPFRTVKFTYPDGAGFDVEAMAALPNRELVFITKEVSLMTAKEPSVFALGEAAWLRSKEPPAARFLGTLPVRKWLPDKGFLGTAVTDAAVNADREVLGILTYAALVEMPLNQLTGLKEARALGKEIAFSVVPIKALNQQEAMTYLPSGGRVMWTSEFLPPKTPVYTVECERTGY